jgi:hypothetical protein
MTETPPPPPQNHQLVSGQKTSKAAIWSLVLGILSNLCLWLLGSIPAIILGVIAIKNINRDPAAIGGKGMAIAGIITGVTGLLIGSGVVAIFFLGVSGYKKGADRAKCILQMATLEKLVVSHAGMHGIGPGESVASSVLVSEGYIPAPYTCPESGAIYTYTDRVPTGKSGTKAFATCDQKSHAFNPNP